MSKSIELTQSQIKAYEDGATVFIFPLSNEAKENIDKSPYYVNNGNNFFFIEDFSPIQKGDKNIFIKEDFGFYKDGSIAFRYPNKKAIDLDHHWIDRSKMTKEQSRYSLAECIDVRVVRIQDIDNRISWRIAGNNIPKEFLFNGGLKFYALYNAQMQEQNINRTYEDNDYVFLCECRR